MSVYFYETLKNEYLEDFHDITWRCALKPDAQKFPTYEKDHILDEDKTVRWNREQVALAKECYDEEVKRLEHQRIEAVRKINEDVEACISEEIRDSLKFSDTEAKSLATFIIKYAQQRTCDYNSNVDGFIERVIMITDFMKYYMRSYNNA